MTLFLSRRLRVNLADIWILICSVSAAFVLLLLPAGAEEILSQAQSKPGYRSFHGTSFAFHVPSGDLGEALQEWARVTKFKLLVATEVISGFRTEGLSGTFTAETALQRLMAATPLQYGLSGARTVAIYDPNAGLSARAQSTALPEIRVTGHPQPAPALQAPAQDTERANGRVVGYVAKRSATGTKTDTPLIETPQSISVVTRDQMDAQEANSAKQALRYTAGVAADSRSNFGGFDIMYSRGFILDQYWDGMKLPGAFGFFPPQPELFGIQRVEVLRGPSSVLYGQGSPGGLVNLVSKLPSDIASNELVLQGGSYDRLQGGFDSTGRLDKNGEFLYRLVAFAKDANNQVGFVKDKRYYISPAITWRPTNNTNWTLKFDYQKDPAVGYYNFVPARGSLFPNPAGSIPTSFYAGDPNFNKITRTTTAGTSLFEHHFSDVFTVRQNSRYIDTKGDLNQVFPLLLSGNSDLFRYSQATQERIKALTTDTHAELKVDTGWASHKLLFGVDTQNISYNQAQARNSPLFGSPTPPNIDIFNPAYGFPILNPFDDPDSLENGRIEQSLRQTGIYAQDQIKIDRLNVLAGIRRDIASNSTSNLDLAFGANTLTKVYQHDEATTGRIGATYEFDGGFVPFAAYATSFSPQVGTTASGNPLKPTTAEIYEAGIKFQPQGANIFAQFSVFDITQQNVSTIDPANSSFRMQIGEVRSRGWEIEGKASLSKSLDVIASYSHVNPVVTQSNDVDLGKRPTWVPRDIGAVWADYTFREGSLNGFGLAMGVRYTGQTWGDPENILLNIPAFTLWDAAVHYDFENFDSRLKGMKLSVNATNLFDKSYVSQCTVQALDNACIYGLRRQVIATLRYKW